MTRFRNHHHDEARQAVLWNVGWKAAYVAASVVFALFALSLCDHLISASLCCADDAYFATAAKNLAFGHGYGSTYVNRPPNTGDIYLFDPAITLGPGLIIPGAMAIRAFGNQYWVPGALVVAFNLVFLGLVFRRLAKVSPGRLRWILGSIIGVMGLNVITIGHYWHWYAFLGEIPTLLLISLGLLLALDVRQRSRDVVIGGLVLGWAYQVKTLALLSVPVVVVALASVRAREGMQGSKGGEESVKGLMGVVRGLRSAALLLLFFVVPTLLFEAYKLANLGISEYQSLKVAEMAIVKSRGSGIDGITGDEPFNYLHDTALRNWKVLTGYFRSEWSAAAFLLALVLGLLAKRRWLGQDSPIPLVMTGISSLYTIWWILLSDRGKIRYLLIALGLWVLSVVFDLFCDRVSARNLALALAFSVALLPRSQYLKRIAPPEPWFEPSQRTSAMLRTARFLEMYRNDRVLVADWWASGIEMEYLLDGTANLIPHWRLKDKEIPLLFVECSKWIDFVPGVRNRWDKAIVRHGVQEVFKEGPYRIYAFPPIGEEATRSEPSS